MVAQAFTRSNTVRLMRLVRSTVFLHLALPFAAASSIVVHCSAVRKTCTTVTDPGADWTAKASYNETVEAIGWGTLDVTTNADENDDDQAFAAGFAESALTWERTSQHRHTFMEATFANDSKSYDAATQFVLANDQWVLEQLKAPPGGDEQSEWWNQLSLIWAQLDGLIAGHAAYDHSAHITALTRLDFLLLNAVVDLSSVIHKPFLEHEWTPERAAAYTRRSTHCSALVKILPDFSDLLTSHNTWTAYYMMLRVAKRYTLPYKKALAASFVTSGYFGTLSSTDDFSVLSSGLVVQETTNALYNDTLALAIVPQAVLTWARSLVANRLATGGETWVKNFVYMNSGTINNQWMVVDYNLFSPGKVLPANVLWVVEQLPLYTQAADVTAHLVNGHWPSYNCPFFPEVYARSGQAMMAAKFGDQYTYQLYSRAKIFRRDAGAVHGRDAMKAIMRYNDWQHDSYALNDPGTSIASRSDLQEGGLPCCADGNIDAKLVGFEDVKAVRFEGVSGPTHDQQPVFEWTEAYSGTPHYGQPNRFAFGWTMLFG